MNEDIKQYKISVPLIDIEELTIIDNYYNEIVNEYLEKCLKEKEEIIVQRIMMNLRKENQELKSKLESSEKARIEAIEFINGAGEMASYTKSIALYGEEIEELLKILDIDKGE